MTSTIQRVAGPFFSRTLLTVLLAAVVVWLARFRMSSSFGLYEDDWTRVPRAIEMDAVELGRFLLENLVTFRGQGRPLHQDLIYALSAVGWAAGGLSAIYLTGYLVVTSNVVLAYLLMRRIHSHEFALVGAIAFSLYAADTTQAFITHSLGLQPALTFLLLAAHAYLSRRFRVAYFLVLVSLLTYETPFLVFLAMPLLAYPWHTGILRRMGAHCAVMGVLFVGVVVLRLSVGETDLASLRTDASLSTSLGHLLEGPVRVFASFLDQAREVRRSMNLDITVVMAVASLAFAAILYRWAVPRDEQRSNGPGEPRIAWRRTGIASKSLWLSAREIFSHHAAELRLLGASAAMLALAYPLTFTTDPSLVFGRVTRVHFAAVVGYSLFTAAAWTLLVRVLRRETLRIAVAAAMALYFGVLLGFGQLVQRSYTESWAQQRAFWRQLLTLAADADDGVAIVVDSSGLDAGLHIGANSWNMPRVLEGILHFPQEWMTPPSAYRMNAGWLTYLDAGHGSLTLAPPATDSPRDHIRSVESTDMILIITDGGLVARQTSPIEVNGRAYPVRPRSPGVLPLLGRRPLYELLIEGPPA